MMPWAAAPSVGAHVAAVPPSVHEHIAFAWHSEPGVFPVLAKVAHTSRCAFTQVAAVPPSPNAQSLFASQSAPGVAPVMPNAAQVSMYVATQMAGVPPSDQSQFASAVQSAPGVAPSLANAVQASRCVATHVAAAPPPVVHAPMPFSASAVQASCVSWVASPAVAVQVAAVPPSPNAQSLFASQSAPGVAPVMPNAAQVSMYVATQMAGVPPSDQSQFASAVQSAPGVAPSLANAVQAARCVERHAGEPTTSRQSSFVAAVSSARHAVPSDRSETAAQLAASAGTESTAGTAFNVASTQLATAGSAATSYVTKQPAGHVSVHTAGAHVSGVHVPTAVDVNRQAWIAPSSYVHEPAAVHGPSPLAA